MAVASSNHNCRLADARVDFIGILPQEEGLSDAIDGLAHLQLIEQHHVDLLLNGHVFEHVEHFVASEDNNGQIGKEGNDWQSHS